MCKITTGLLKSCFYPVCILKSSSLQNSKKPHVFSPCAYNVISVPFSEENKCLTLFIPTGPEKLTPLKQLTCDLLLPGQSQIICPVLTERPSGHASMILLR